MTSTRRLPAALAAVAMLALVGACAQPEPSLPVAEPIVRTNAEPGDITLWLAGPDTPTELRDYLVETFEAENPGSTLTIEQQDWTGLVGTLMSALPRKATTPDVVEIGNTQSSTFTTIGAFREISSELYEELGGDLLLPSFVKAGAVGSKKYALPYYFGSRYMFFRKDIWSDAGLEVPETLAEFGDAVRRLRTDERSGFAIGGQDWRNGISWVFANGGYLALERDGRWESTLSDPNTIAGLEMWQDVFQGASNLPSTTDDTAYWDLLNNGQDGAPPAAATIMGPSWMRWSIGDMTKNDAGEEVRDGMADESTFGIFALPGISGGAAPVFAGGSNLAISAKTQHPELAENLLRIVYSDTYQTLLAQAGLGPASTRFTELMTTDADGDQDKFGIALVDTALNAELTPAAPGWAEVEDAQVYEELFQQIAEGADVTELAAEYDEKITPMLNRLPEIG